jgi:uncharacterized OB-fold protein
MASSDGETIVVVNDEEPEQKEEYEICPNCGYQIFNDEKVCSNCGYEQ